jgi:hypothetical protein
MLFCLLLLLGNTKAQGGIFNQNQQMTRNLVIQIGLFQTYLGYLKKGYDIVNKGVSLVRDIKDGEFSLHKDYFSSLKNVNPKIKNYSKVAEIISLQLSILDQYHKTFSKVKSSKLFGERELKYFSSVYSNLLDETAKSLDELILLTTSGNLELTDDERIGRLDKLYEDMKEKHSFIQHFNDKVRGLGFQRNRELLQIHMQQSLEGQ